MLDDPLRTMFCSISTRDILEKGRKRLISQGVSTLGIRLHVGTYIYIFSELNPEVEPEVESEAESKHVGQPIPAHTMHTYFVSKG